MKAATFHKMLGGKTVIVVLGLLFFVMYGCGQKEEPVKPLQSSGLPESSEQKESIQFPGLGVLEVTAQAVEGQLPTVTTRDATKKILLKISMGNTYPGLESFRHNAGIEFKVRHISGLPDPLLMVVAVGPGGSDAAWEITLISIVSGEIKRLWKQTDPLNYDGGIFVGDLGQGKGLGIAQWNFIWGNGESHVDPHRHWLQLYCWNKEKSQFDVGPHYITKDKRGPSKVPAEFGFNFSDQRKDFKRLADFW